MCKMVASRPHGVFLGELVRLVHGPKEAEDTWGGSDAEYQRTRRFLTSNPEIFEIRKPSGLICAEPTLALFDLINDGIIQNRPESASIAGIDFCRDLLESVDELNEKGKRLLEQNFREYVDRINDLWLILHADRPDVVPEYISLPYKTRFNDRGRIKKQWAILSSELEKAGEQFDHAAMVTLTSDPKKFDGLLDAVDQMSKSWNNLMSWLSSDSRLGYRPEYVKVLEFMESGNPHFHVIFFLEDESTRADGMPWLVPKQELSSYWAKHQAEIVDMQPLIWQDDLDENYEAETGWVRWRRDGDHGGQIEGPRTGGQTAGQYLGKYLSAIYGGIMGAGTEELVDEDEIAGKYEEKAATWKVAMYWATKRRIRTESRDLRQAVDEDLEDDLGDELTEIIRSNRYEFVGAYPSGQIPPHIRNGLVDVDALQEAIAMPTEEEVRLASDRPPPLSKNERILRRAPARARPMIEGMLSVRLN